MHNILLEIDGSADSLAAVNVAMSLTSLVPQSRVTAQYVLDTPGIWNFLGMQDPGLVGSGPYFQAFDSIKISLRELAETVVESYRARCNSIDRFAEMIIDEGEWLSLVAERSRALQPLVVIGKSTLVRVAKEANKTPAEIGNSISYPVVVVDRELVPSACFPVIGMGSIEIGTELKLSQPETVHNLIAKAECLPHAA
jgi:hypothetical protein